MKKNLFLTAVAIMGMASCADNVLVDEQQPNGLSSSAITFENVLTNNATRAAKTAFVAKDSMGIYGFQDSSTKIFNNQGVGYDGTDWSYSPLKYWNAGSQYEFYGIYPYNSSVVAQKTAFNDSTRIYTVTDYKVTTDQVDIMIAEKKVAHAFDRVDMTFNHILSNVNFIAKLSPEVSTTSIKNIIVDTLKITGLKSEGTFIQTPTTGDVDGTWTDLNEEYEFLASNDTLKSGAQGTMGSLVLNHLMMPQPLFSTLYIRYRIVYNDGSATTFRKSIPLESIKANGTPLDRWNLNTVYTYTMVLNPDKQPSNYENVAIDWDGSENGDATKTPGSKLVGPDENGEYKVVVTDSLGHTTAEYPVVWEDVDGDGRLEGGVDHDGDGHIDNVDGDKDNKSNPQNPAVSDNGENGKDVILVDTNGDGTPDTQLEKIVTPIVAPENPTQYGIDWNGSKDANGNASSSATDETKPMSNSRLVMDENGDYHVEVDRDGNGIFNEAADTIYAVQWADLDGDGKQEGYVGNVDEGQSNNDSNNSLVTDGNAKNPRGYDVILLDTDGDGVCDTQLEKILQTQVVPVVEQGTAITFGATIQDWTHSENGEIEIVTPKE